MSLYNVRIKRLALLLLPTVLRKPLVAAFMQSAVQGCNILHGEFMRWRDKTDYRLRHNGQICHLRAVLNDIFDQTERRITVEDRTNNDSSSAQVFMRDMDRHVLLPMRGSGKAFILNRRGYGGASGFDFWVSIPYDLMGKFDEARLAAVVDTYKLASKRWTINYN